jgi:hypothetical protein
MVKRLADGQGGGIRKRRAYVIPGSCVQLPCDSAIAKVQRD